MNLRRRIDRLTGTAARSLHDWSDEELGARLAELAPRVTVNAPEHIRAISAGLPLRASEIGADDLATLIAWLRQESASVVRSDTRRGG